MLPFHIYSLGIDLIQVNKDALHVTILIPACTVSSKRLTVNLIRMIQEYNSSDIKVFPRYNQKWQVYLHHSLETCRDDQEMEATTPIHMLTDYDVCFYQNPHLKRRGEIRITARDNNTCIVLIQAWKETTPNFSWSVEQERKNKIPTIWISIRWVTKICNHSKDKMQNHHQVEKQKRRTKYWI